MPPDYANPEARCRVGPVDKAEPDLYKEVEGLEPSQ